MNSNVWILGWPDHNGRSEVRYRYHPHASSRPGELVGFVRAVSATPTQTRYFAETVDRMPIEGTYTTKRAAADAVIAEHERTD